MSTEWWQIIIVCAVVVPLTILAGRYFMWRRWDKERRQLRMARRMGFALRLERVEAIETDWAWRKEKPGFSVKV